MTSTRVRLPFTLTPLPGEPFGLWWHAYAVALEVTRADLAHTVGIPAGKTPGPEHASRIAAATGVTSQQLDGMFTTARGCPPDYVLHVWEPQPVTRFCPACLSDVAAMRPAWRLPLTFYCLTHHRPLSEGCHGCGALLSGRVTLSCMDAVTAGPARTALSCPRCGHDLTAGPADDKADAAAANAQRRITTALQRLRDPAVSPQAREQAQEELTDLTLIALHIRQNSIGRLRSFTRAMPDGAVLTEAVALFTDHHDDGRTEDRLASLVVRRQRGTRPQAVPFSWRAASPALSARIAHARDDSLAQVDRIRYATTLPHPIARPPRAADPAPARAARLPDQLWPDWAIRLSDQETLGGNFFRSAVIVGLLLPHSQLTISRICALLPHRPHAAHVVHQFRRLLAGPGGRSALRILTELGLALDQADIPIDYQRRRHLVREIDLIDRPTWNTLCRDSGLRVGRHRRLDQARRYLYELLTGNSLTTAPEPYRLPEQGPRADHVEFCAAVPADLTAAITEHAERLLTDAGITGEPLTWSPPIEWVSTTAWPGADPERTDPEPIHQALQARWAAGANGHWAPTQAIADQLGISGHHMRYVLRRHPLPNAPYVDRRRGSVRPATLPDGIGHRIDPHPDHPHRGFLVDPAWLREQYTTWGRTLRDLAGEIGCHPSALRSFTETQGIPRRPRSGGKDGYISTGAITTHPAQLPKLLRQALTGRDARARLERFLRVIEYPSLGQAAKYLGLHQGTLTQQVQGLERACGGQLLHRQPAPRPIGPLTPLGHQLCQQARDHLNLTPTP